MKVSLIQFDAFTEGLKHRKFSIFKKCHLQKLQQVKNTFFTLFENQHEVLCSDAISREPIQFSNDCSSFVEQFCNFVFPMCSS